MVSSGQFVIVVTGPTATGKSALAEALATRLDGEIVSADSMQVYRGMDIGTAKVPLCDRSVTYHCLDLVLPDEEFNAFTYQKEARKAFSDIWGRNRQPVLCGGTGLYIRAAVDDFIEGEQESDAGLSEARRKRRQRLNAEAEALGAEAFHARLAALDARSANLIHPHNVRRVVRAFEWLEEGSSYAEQVSGFSSYHTVFPTRFLGLEMPRTLMYERIDARVDAMMRQGLFAEVCLLYEQGYEHALTAKQAIGYKELLAVIGGKATLEEAVSQIKKATRHYAKRQLSWFRRDKRIVWLDALLPFDELVNEAGKVVLGNDS